MVAVLVLHLFVYFPFFGLCCIHVCFCYFFVISLHGERPNFVVILRVLNGLTKYEIDDLSPANDSRARKGRVGGRMYKVSTKTD